MYPRLPQRIQRIRLHLPPRVRFVPNDEDLGIGLVVILRLGQPVLLETLHGGESTSKL